MKLGLGPLRQLRHLERYREILRVLIKYGFAQVLDELHLYGLRERIFARGRKKADGAAPQTMEARLRMALTELGPAFVKLGQLLSTRADLLPPSFIEELSRLQDRVPPFPTDQAEAILASELNAALESRFARFDPEPLAAASIGQVHRALLHTGEEVVVKIKRPGVDEVVRRDLDILIELASFVDRNTHLGPLYQFTRIAEEMKQLLLRELDYTIEARNAQRFRQNFAAEGRVYMPRVFWESSTRNVLTLEYREGISLNRYLEQPLLQPPPQKVAAVLADVFFKQIFVDGFFHGDPHPGNIAVLPDGRLFFMDFGSAGHISETVRGKFIAIARALQGYDSAAAVDELLGLAFVPPVINRLELIRDLDELLEDYFELPLQNIVISEAIRRLMQVAVKHRLRFPHELTLLARAVVTLEGTVSRLDPEFSLADAARKYALELQRRQLKLELRRFRSAWRGYRRLFEEFPEQAKEILRASAAGELKLKLELPQLEPVMKTVKNMVNRLSFSIVLASLIIALSQSLQLGHSAWLEKFPLAEIVLVGALCAGIWWLVSIFRSGRM